MGSPGNHTLKDNRYFLHDSMYDTLQPALLQLEV